MYIHSILTVGFLSILPVSAIQYANFNTGNYAYPFAAVLNHEQSSISEQIGFGDSSGTFTVTTSTTGSSWGYGGSMNLPGGPTGVPISEDMVHPDFTSTYSVENLTVLSFSGAPDQTVTFDLDFTTLVGGFLPAGSVIVWGDVDGVESATLTATSTTPTIPWYKLDSTDFYQAGITLNGPYGSDQPAPTAADFPTATGTVASTLELNGPGPSLFTDSVANFIVTQTDITHLQIVAEGETGVNFTQSLAVGIVPEPSTAGFGLLATSLFFLRRRP
jgi:hypothetical protein